MKRIASTHRRQVKAVIGLLAGSLLLAGPALAQFELEEGEDLPYPGERDLLRRELTRPTSEIELGAHFLSEDSFKFGQFKGLEDKGWEPLGRFNLEQRALWDSGEVWQWQLQGQNLGLDSRFLRGDYEQQGRFGVFLEYDKIPNFLLENGLTPFGGRGRQVLRLPSGWVPAMDADDFPALDDTLDRFDVQFDREAIRGGFNLILPERWELDVEWEREYRDGERITGAVIGSNGGNPRTALVPQPIDLQTTEVDAKIRYGGQTAQMELGYYFSDLDNVDESLTWTNPYALLMDDGDPDWAPEAGFPAPGRKSTGPDNYFNQVTFSGGLNLPERTRVMLNAAYGVMRQNDDFLPYTVNSGLSVTQPLPETDLDGEIQTTLVNLRLVSRPVDRLRLEAGYRLDDRDNNTPRNLFFYVPGDSADQNTDLAGSTARINRPYSYKLNEVQAEIGYELLPRTELSFGYEHELIDRTFTEREETREDFFRAALQSMPTYQLTFRADYEFSTRDGSDYEGNAQLFAGFTDEHVEHELDDQADALAGVLSPAEIAELLPFENAPGLRKFYLADRDRNSLRAQVTWAPVEDLSLGVVGEWLDDDYEDAELGLQEVTNTNVTLDAAYALLENVSVHAFYTYENLESEQDGRYFPGYRIANAFDPDSNWAVEDDDEADTVGAGLDVDLLNGRLLLSADYAYSRTEGSVDVTGGPNIDTAPLPDVMMRLHNASLQAEYRVRPDFSVHFGYLFEWLRADDWATDDVGVVVPGVEQTLFIDQEPPDYRAHLFALSFSYKFW